MSASSPVSQSLKDHSCPLAVQPPGGTLLICVTESYRARQKRDFESQTVEFSTTYHVTLGEFLTSSASMPSCV